MTIHHNQNRMYLDFLARAGKILNSSGDLMPKINNILIMLTEFFSIRNAMLLIRDNVACKYNIELSPELTEMEQKQANELISAYLSRFSWRFEYPMILYPDEAKELPLLYPEGLKEDFIALVSCPITGQTKNIPLGILFAFVKDASLLSDQIKILKILSDMMGASLEAHGFQSQKIYDLSHKPVPMIFEGIVGRSEGLKSVADVIGRISTSRASVLVRGESGTGKELIAKAVHRHSLRRSAPFISVNCAALSESLLASELFGHEKGAFTGALTAKKGRFELADGGTLFLDEIGDTSLDFQTKLLRVLQEGEFERLGGVKTIKVDVRIICATNVDLEKSIREDTFREDLYYRLNVIPLHIPPLRERKEDIPLLVNHFLMKLNKEYGRSVRITEEDMLSLQEGDWPGNIRELENVVHRAFLMDKKGVLHIKPLTDLNKTGLYKSNVKKNKNYQETKSRLHDEELQAIERALKSSRGIQVKAARLLGISVRQLRYRIKKNNLEVRKIRL